MIVTATGKSECPECGQINEFEAEYNDGETDVECSECGLTYEVTYTVNVEVI